MRRVLLVLDASPNASIGLEFLAGLDRAPDRECRIVGLRRGALERGGRLRLVLDDAARLLESRGWRIPGSDAGRVRDLRRIASEWQPDLVVLSGIDPRAFPWPSRTASAELLASAGCPVLIARGPAVHDVLLPVDEPGATERQSEWLSCDPFARSWVRVLGIVDVGVPWYATMGFSPQELFEAVGSYAAELRQARTEAVSRIALGLSKAGIAARAEIREGPSADVVVHAAADRRTDLIILDVGDGRGSLRRSLRLTHRLLRNAGCSVLLTGGRA